MYGNTQNAYTEMAYLFAYVHQRVLALTFELLALFLQQYDQQY